ncbi:MAG: META domain-containing protein [Pseudomonas sp.]|nr:MAG: META domain-containing protein [Pseudomonas sp.]
MSNAFRFLVVILSMGLLAACASSGPGSTMPALAGTHWELFAIQSMDDAQGTTRIGQPGKFTVSFGADGRASFRLDCNRGTGAWKATPATDGVSGSIEFGPVEATRALCPPPHLDEKIARDLGYMRGYLFKDGKLYLSLMADGGIYEWQPLKP